MAPDEPSFALWLKTEVAPKLAVILDELNGNQKFDHPVVFAFLSSPSNGITPYVYWVKEHQPTPNPVGASLSPSPSSSLSNRAGVALEGILDAQGVKWDNGVYRPAEFLGGDVWGRLNEECRRYGFRWNKDAKGWVRA